MTKQFHAQLDQILQEDRLEPTTPAPDNPLTRVQQLADELADAQRKVSELEQQYSQATEQLLGSLAVAIRSTNPNLQVGLRNGSCSVGYCSKQLHFKPDLKARSWNVAGPDEAFARRFGRSCGPAIMLTDDMSPLTDAIGQFFKGHYRSLTPKR